MRHFPYELERIKNTDKRRKKQNFEWGQNFALSEAEDCEKPAQYNKQFLRGLVSGEVQLRWEGIDSFYTACVADFEKMFIQTSAYLCRRHIPFLIGFTDVYINRLLLLLAQDVFFFRQEYKTRNIALAVAGCLISRFGLLFAGASVSRFAFTNTASHFFCLVSIYIETVCADCFRVSIEEPSKARNCTALSFH